jgi:hypothetical protein
MSNGGGLVFDGGADGDSDDVLHFDLFVWYGLERAVVL